MEDNLSRLFLNYNAENTNTSNLFSFIDESNKYQNVGNYQKTLSKIITDYGPLILSESISQSCNINATDKTTYINKLSQLQNILNGCSLAVNKEECFYNQFMNDNTLALINDLSNIVKKINTSCISSNITPTIKQEMCLNKNYILNNYSSSDITKIKNFIVKYNDVIKSIKNISDNYLSFYLNNCDYDFDKINAYKDLQSTLSSTLFELNKTNTTLATTNNTPAQTTQNSTVTSQTSQISDLTSQNSTLTSQNATLSSQISALTTLNSALTTQKATLTSQNATLTSQNSALTQQVNKLTEDLNQKNKKLEIISGETMASVTGTSLSTVSEISNTQKIIFFTGLGIIGLIILIFIFLLIIKKNKMKKTTLTSKYSSSDSIGSSASILQTGENKEANNKFRNILFSGLKTLGNYV
jgi:predicted  nucleic acid-binding Zn-ribbon protein